MRIRLLLKIALGFVGFAALVSAVAVVHWHLGVKSALSFARDLIVAISLIAVFIAINWLSEAKAQSIFKNWATEQGYTIVRFKRAFLAGAFSFWNTSRGQRVYFITVRNNKGVEQNACVRCGFGGGILFSNKIEIKWLDEPKPS